MRLTLLRLAAALVPLPGLIACATGGLTAHDPNVITAAQLAPTRAATAYDAVRQVRPEMFRSRSPGSLQLFSTRRAAVVMDNTVLGGIEALRTVPTADVARIQYLNSWKTAQKYGLESRDGLLLVTRRDSSGTQLSMRGRGSKR